jgi:hypothetical protein
LVGLDKVVWGAAMDQEAGTVTFSYLGRDGEEVGRCHRCHPCLQGYPGDVLYNVRYSLDSEVGITTYLPFTECTTCRRAA